MVIAQQSPPDTLQCSWMLVSASGWMNITKKDTREPEPRNLKPLSSRFIVLFQYCLF